MIVYYESVTVNQKVSFENQTYERFQSNEIGIHWYEVTRDHDGNFVYDKIVDLDHLECLESMFKTALNLPEFMKGGSDV
jgi:hypothetical protein